ncbi:FAD-binding oxidoreductase [Pseudochrobactrum asaccharolyticum]|uniref:FAD/FMN-containing dehydrogenase n=1 Tax=Pseudochrobactrum asaccharolyticum TaxID=354351 RepID=A0A366DMB5_9HYPH|nr:FAD-binding oxidoreductase [Pseudochrobactrum asaccharolyticum]RBO91085.1 FAD/FMN-containing dehydrogenase [Pseudochrobactrum asaccharolyticum]
MQHASDRLAVLEKLSELLGKDIQTAENIDSSQLRDWSDEQGGTPLALVLPRNTQMVSEILKLCNEHHIAVVPQGGLTGLAGGAVPVEGCVLLSLRNMNRIEAINAQAGTMIVEAGVILQTIQDAARNAGMNFALDLGARGSCQIGGNISTNAGGNRVIRYGMTRDLVLGLEAVLADGTILSMMNEMPKNNAALDMKHLFIGAEGTMGVVTRAVLRLRSGVGGANAAVVALENFDNALNLLNYAQKRLSGRVTAFEAMWGDYYKTAAKYARAPLEQGYPLYVLMDMQGAEPDTEAELFQSVLEHALEEGWIADAAIAQSHREAEEFWTMRDAIAEIMTHEGPCIGFDVSVPQTQIGAAVDAIQAALEERYPGIQSLFFGHVGDCNFHIDVTKYTDFEPKERIIEDIVYDIIRSFKGSVSAEHGIGLHKKPWLHYSRSEAELQVLKTLKAALDPHNILNPGKVLD